MDKKNILKHFHNKNKQNEFIKENRIKSLYTTIIKSDTQIYSVTKSCYLDFLAEIQDSLISLRNGS